MSLDYMYHFLKFYIILRCGFLILCYNEVNTFIPRNTLFMGVRPLEYSLTLYGELTLSFSIEIFNLVRGLVYACFNCFDIAENLLSVFKIKRGAFSAVLMSFISTTLNFAYN